MHPSSLHCPKATEASNDKIINIERIKHDDHGDDDHGMKITSKCQIYLLL